MKKVYIIDAKRTAIGKFLGSLYESDPADVCAQVIASGFTHQECLKDVESVIIGNVISAGMGQGIARKIAIKAGIPQSTPAYSVNMVCGSGMQAIMNGINEVRGGEHLFFAAAWSSCPTSPMQPIVISGWEKSLATLP